MTSNKVNKTTNDINTFHEPRNNLEDDPECNRKTESSSDDVTGLWQFICDKWNTIIPNISAYETKYTDEERLEKIFNQLDRKGNGRIDIHDLSASLKAFGMSDKYAEVS